MTPRNAIESPPSVAHEADGDGVGHAELVFVVVLGLAFSYRLLVGAVSGPLVDTWTTIFMAITIQALPFLALGVVVSGVLAVYVSAEWIARFSPSRPTLAVAQATAAGIALPGCECGSVPISQRLVARGVTPAAALAFMLSAPAINPVVLVSTAVAFPGRPDVVLARFLASLLTAFVVGLIWARFGDVENLVRRAEERTVVGASRLETFVATVRHDFLHAGGYLVVGAAVAATLQVFIPRSIIQGVAGNEWLAVLAMALLAVLLSICSEADAFVVASFGQFSLTSRLVFLVVGPTVDLKLVALQAGIHGRAFAARFAPLTLVVALVMALAVGSVIL